MAVVDLVVSLGTPICCGSVSDFVSSLSRIYRAIFETEMW